LIQAIGFLQLGSLDPTVAFSAALDDVMAVTPEPLSDVDAGFLARLNNQFQVPVNGVLTSVPAIVDLPENPSATNPPYIQITPWSVKPLVDAGGSEPIVDNYTTTGACVRPRPVQVQAEYRIDAYAQNRAQKTQLLDSMLTTFSGQPYLVVDDERLPLVPIEIPAVETANFTPPGRTPLFYQLDCWLETGQRQMYPQAVPYLVLGPLNGKDTVEKVKV
jgi:hypothetical protein